MGVRFYQSAFRGVNSSTITIFDLDMLIIAYTFPTILGKRKTKTVTGQSVQNRSREIEWLRHFRPTSSISL